MTSAGRCNYKCERCQVQDRNVGVRVKRVRQAENMLHDVCERNARPDDCHSDPRVPSHIAPAAAVAASIRIQR